METSKHHSNSKTKQRHEHRHIIQTHLTPLIDSKNTGEDTTLIHHKQHHTHLHTTWLQKQPLCKHRTTQHKQHHRNRLQPKQTTRCTIRVALDMSKIFDTVNIHPHIHKLHQTNITHTISNRKLHQMP